MNWTEILMTVLGSGIVAGVLLYFFPDLNVHPIVTLWFGHVGGYIIREYEVTRQ